MLDDIVVHKLEEGVITVKEEKVVYINEAANHLFPELEKGSSGGFLRKEFPNFEGIIDVGGLSFTYKKIPNGEKLHYIFSSPKKQVVESTLSGKEIVRFCQLVAKESDDIFAQLQCLPSDTLEYSRIRVHASRLQRMADMLHHSLEAIYVEPSGKVDLYLLLEEIGAECEGIFSAMGVTLSLEKTEIPVLLHSKKRELQRIFFLLFSVYGKKGETLQITCEQFIHKVTVHVETSTDTEIKGLELHCFQQLLEGLEGKMLPPEEGKKGITLQFKVGQLPTQLQSGNQGRMIPLLGTNGLEKAVYLPQVEIFMANCLPEDFFCDKNQKEDKEVNDNSEK